MNKLTINAGNLIKYKRKVKGYSTQELAKLLDVSPGLINNIENAKTDTFNLELLYKISSTLDIPITDILSYNMDTILTSAFDNNPEMSSLKLNLEPLLKAIIQISNNKNLTSDKVDIFLDKVVDDINFYNKISSL
ncbi:helix-turn-helix transcriptional regulator [Clostridium tertium]|jgi:transcriptional regulator with XRE-family HTH domain|uniref:helix-turn-helix transcriptional regulator n=1 Tax=Clostridium tertium TaxID=1559 RepID=UPI001158C2E6|nr:helix-turn-helix transcriptional regulator [Clostridium tertium]